MKGLHVVKMVVGDGPLKHCSHYALPKEKKGQSTGREMTPLDLLSCDIFVFRACHPANMDCSSKLSQLYRLNFPPNLLLALGCGL